MSTGRCYLDATACMDQHRREAAFVADAFLADHRTREWLAERLHVVVCRPTYEAGPSLFDDRDAAAILGTEP
jgi:hypothetical protein